ncbi:DUF418 domain-containing protein [Allosphingosinicella indica]|uniref:DUF418 domain-containing protein n=1 Tax=Allosphingosinicella indica TaxID=941907 RepID=A0A1X7GET3_9SPHN|nr:DUF418 domain-containing protein [Allosphingosinicella indica]SMF67932.1 uncharacterized protein SAMN06295910_1574 [Allosphingosinicella indica]
MGEQSAAPARDRIEALDFVRGAALLGILLLNITGFGLPDSYVNPANAGGSSGPDLWSWIVIQVGFEGTQRALFAILFGAGAILFTRNLEAKGGDSAPLWFRRNFWLIVFGMVNGYLLLWFGDILFSYGVIAFGLYAFRHMAPKRLLALGLAMLVASAAWNLWDATLMLNAERAARPAIEAQAAGEELSPAQTAALERWDAERVEYESSADSMQADIKARTQGYAAAFPYLARITYYFQTWGLIRYFFDAFGMMLIGMGLFGLGVLTLERPGSVYLAMVAIGYGIGIPVNIIETKHVIDGAFAASAFAEANISYDLGRLPLTMGHLGLLLLFVRLGAIPALRRALAAVGRMALTSYMMQSAICGILFLGLGWYGQLQRHELYYIVAAIWAFQIAFAVLWLARFRFGPMEYVWRWLTYGARPPMKR